MRKDWAACPCTSSVIMFAAKGLCTVGSDAAHQPDALEMMASSPPGGFAPGSNSPFQPSFFQTAPPGQPTSPSQPLPAQSRQPLDPSAFGPASPSHGPRGPLSLSGPDQRQHHQPGIFGGTLSSPARSPASRSPWHAAGAVSHQSPVSLFSTNPVPALSPSHSSPQSHPGSSGHTASTSAPQPLPLLPAATSQQQQQPQGWGSAYQYTSTGGSGQQQSEHEQTQQQAASPWQPQVAAAGPSWLQPATWQAAGGTGQHWLQGLPDD